MNETLLKFKIILPCALAIIIYSQTAEAQNFVNLVPEQTLQKETSTQKTTSKEEDISDEAIGKILKEAGIPTSQPTQNNQNNGESKYTLGPLDVIQITVMRHPEVSGKFTINNEGKIQYNFVGDIKIAGLTKKQAKEKLVKALSKYIISPEVTVKIVGYNSKVVYVIGEVGRPGKIYMHGDTITVREALIQAALPRLTARASKCKLITPSADGKPKIRNVNVYKLLYEGDLRENLVMKPGDTLFVPPTIMAKAMRVFQPVTGAINSGKGLGATVTTGF